MKEEDVMHITISLYKDGEVVEQKAINLSRLEQRLLVTESVNIVLLRLIMLEKRAGGDMELKTLAFTGSVVKNKYVSGQKPCLFNQIKCLVFYFGFLYAIFSFLNIARR